MLILNAETKQTVQCFGQVFGYIKKERSKIKTKLHLKHYTEPHSIIQSFKFILIQQIISILTAN